jgi:hypothetical protein
MTTKSGSSGKGRKKKAGASSQKGSGLKKTTKKMVDQILLSVSPKIEKQLEQLRLTLDKTPTSIDEFKFLGYKVLERARTLSSTLRSEAAKRTAKKVVKKSKSKDSV